ncbi:MAG TPA: hypothetical protein VGN26_13675 [Armatimonadota bacterium]|jgi:adenylate kinase family enzyme
MSSEQRRVAVIGCAGAGKTTFAEALAARTGARHVELDALFWGPGWTPAGDESFRAAVDEALPADGCWVADGGYSRVRYIVWARAQALVFIDPPFPLVLWRVVRRTVVRSLGRVELWNGNRESLREGLFSRDGLLLWVVANRRAHRAKYEALLADPRYVHLAIRRVRSAREVRECLAALSREPEGAVR